MYVLLELMLILRIKVESMSKEKTINNNNEMKNYNKLYEYISLCLKL